MARRYGGIERVLREPLLHFVLIGAVLFGMERYWGRRIPVPAETARVIRLTQADVNHLVATFERFWKRSPTAEEVAGLIEEHVAEEVYYREALRLGLDRDDPVIRQRLRQKVEFLSEDLRAVGEPTEAQLRAYLEEHAEAFRIEPRYALSQVFLNPEQRGAALTNDAVELLRRLNGESPPPTLAGVGDALRLDSRLEDYAQSDVGRLFGKEFAAGLEDLPLGRWVGPVRSGYGAHLVRVEQRVPGRVPELEEVRRAVVRAWTGAQRQAANEAFFGSLKSQYEVVLDPGITNAPAQQGPQVNAP